ncbi:hypothetical protein WJX73_008150 [Symbiochloris irregularis]|uniref:Molybdenum cofactor sulfurase n=1 Tax=Symbiochloris irregularis TaxID=706552 RepID=A0AAW1NKM1_9CHLO
MHLQDHKFPRGLHASMLAEAGLLFLSLISWGLNELAREISLASTSLVDFAEKFDTAISAEKAAFLQRHQKAYGYRNKIDRMRQQEFARLGKRVYVDHAGSTLYAASQLRAVFKDLEAHVYGNPHSLHGELLGEWGSGAAEAEARRLTLQMCSASAQDYVCIFTAGATGGFRLIAECFPWKPESVMVYTRDNHNSVTGIRESALQAGASALAVDLCAGSNGATCFQPCLPLMSRSLQHASSTEQPVHMFAMPVESNFSGMRYDPVLVTAIQQQGMPGADGESLLGRVPVQEQGRCLVVLDAAKACTTCPPNLAECSADFVALSFYKIFGYPSGLGALLVRKDALPLLRKRYFGGGAVAVSIAEEDFSRQRPGAAGMEDGTSAFLSVAALKHGFAQIHRLGGFTAVEHHTQALTRHMAESLQEMHHGNGRPVCALYGAHAGTVLPDARYMPPGIIGQGPIVTFNIMRPDGTFVGYREVEKLAALNRIDLRAGAFCNPGACAQHLGLTPERMRANFEAGHVCWDDHDVIDGIPTGAVRVSFGYMSTFEDAAAVLQFVREFFHSAQAQQDNVNGQMNPAADPKDESSAIKAPPGMAEDFTTSSSLTPVLEAIFVYPIKSCAGFSPSEWSLGPNGLLYDREWVLIDESGVALTQKSMPQLGLLRPRIDRSAGVMIVRSPTAQGELRVSVPPQPGSTTHTPTTRVSVSPATSPMVTPLASLAASDIEAGLSDADDNPNSSVRVRRSRLSETPEQVVQVGESPELKRIKVCSDTVATAQAGAMEVVGSQLTPQEWLRQAVGLPCHLVRQQPGSRRSSLQRAAQEVQQQPMQSRNTLGFANEGQYLLLNSSSLRDLRQRLSAAQADASSTDSSSSVLPSSIFAGVSRFRPNFVIGAADLAPFSEDAWRFVQLGPHFFHVTGPCARCEIICIDAANGVKSGPEPLLTLARYRRQQGRILFGILLDHDFN